MYRSTTHALTCAVSGLRCFATTRVAAGKTRQAAIRRKKRNVERQRVLSEERSPSNFDAVKGIETDFTRALLTPARVLAAARSSSSTGTDTTGGSVSVADASLDFNAEEVYRVQTSVEDALQARLKAATRSSDATSSTSASARSPPPAASRGGVRTEGEQLTGLARDLSALEISEAGKRVASCRIVSLLNANSRTLQAYNTAFALREFARSAGDTGSSEVQAAVLTTRILALGAHFASQGTARKDKHSWRGYRMLVHKRQKLLKYLRTESTDRYFDCIGRLGLSDAAVMREISM